MLEFGSINLPKNQNQKKVDFIQNNTYVRVIGSIKGFQGRKSVVAHRITPLTDHNELTHHILETIYISKTNPNQIQNVGVNNNNNNMGNSSHKLSNINNGDGIIAQVTTAIKIISESKGASGASVQDIASALKKQHSEIKQVCDSLMMEGYIYTTTDDDHFNVEKKKKKKKNKNFLFLIFVYLFFEFK